MLDLGMRAHGFAVWLAASCSAAVELYRGNHNAIDVVLLDVRMPAQDGPETFAALREHDPHVCVCFMTGDTGNYIDENLLALGAVAVFKKPFRITELARELKTDRRFTRIHRLISGNPLTKDDGVRRGLAQCALYRRGRLRLGRGKIDSRFDALRSSQGHSFANGPPPPPELNRVIHSFPARFRLRRAGRWNIVPLVIAR